MIVTEDWIYRMLVARKGDIGSIPVNAAGKKATGNWDPAKDAAAGELCKAYGAAGIIRRPGRLNITWADDRTLRIDFDAGMKTRLLHFSEELPPTGYITSEPPVNFAVPNNIGAPSLEGYSVAAWHHQGQARGMGPMQEHYVPSHGGSLAAITGKPEPRLPAVERRALQFKHGSQGVLRSGRDPDDSIPDRDQHRRGSRVPGSTLGDQHAVQA